MLRHLFPGKDGDAADPHLLLDARAGDDAAVYRLSDDLAIVQSVDLITPIVDEPYAFGQIVAANALSDLYAKGATPLMALNVVGFPVKTLPLSVLEEMLRGGRDKLTEAGARLAGGHSIDDDEPKYGMAVTGLVHPARLVSNAGARPGDVLVLTKPLGTGIVTTGIDRRLVSEDTVARITAQMAALNRAAAEAMVAIGAHACTDVTGFGLLGHLHEMALASGVAAEIDGRRVAVAPETWDLVARGAIPEGTRNNHRYLAERVDWDGASTNEQIVLADAQTSGGLLIAVAPEDADRLLGLLATEPFPAMAIGRIVQGAAGRIAVRHR